MGGGGRGETARCHTKKKRWASETVTDGNWSDSGDWAWLSRTRRGVGAGGTLRARGGLKYHAPAVTAAPRPHRIPGGWR